jgi:flagellin
MKANLERMDADCLGVADSDGNKSISIKTASYANKAIEKFDAAIEIVSKERAKYGAIQNRMEYSINNLGIASENMQAAESRIRDTDVAKEMMELSKTKIITDSSVSMLAQANTIPQEVLKLIEN